MSGNRIKEARLKSGHTQDSLGELLGTDARQIWRWENGEMPKGEIVARIAQITQVSADYLLGLADDPTPKFDSDNLNDEERNVLSALRRGEKMEAIRIIASS